MTTGRAEADRRPARPGHPHRRGVRGQEGPDPRDLIRAAVGDDPYGDLADRYHWLYDDFSARGRHADARGPGRPPGPGRRRPGARRRLRRRGRRPVAAPPGAPGHRHRCQPGHGRAVPGRRLARAGVENPSLTCAWAELPGRFSPEFDAVLCTGNSLAHAAVREDRRAALAGFAGVLVGGGTGHPRQPGLVARPPAREPSRRRPLVVTRDGAGTTRHFDWRVPERFGDPISLEITLFVDEGEQRNPAATTVTFRPFTPTSWSPTSRRPGSRPSRSSRTPATTAMRTAARRVVEVTRPG